MTLRLVATFRGNLEYIDGLSASQNFDPLDLPFHRLLNYVYYLAIRESTAEQIQEFNLKLWLPPTNTEVIPPESPWSAEAETAALGAFAAQFQAL